MDTDPEIVEYDENRDEWYRREAKLEAASQLFLREVFEDEQVVSEPVWHVRVSSHGAIFSLKCDYMCSCWVGASCAGKSGYSPCARSDVDGPYADRADAWLYADLSCSSQDRIFERWVELGRPHQSWERWWFKNGNNPYSGYNEAVDEEWNDQVEVGEAEWDEMRRQQRAAGVL